MKTCYLSNLYFETLKIHFKIDQNVFIFIFFPTKYIYIFSLSLFFFFLSQNSN